MHFDFFHASDNILQVPGMISKSKVDERIRHSIRHAKNRIQELQLDTSY